VRIGSPSLTAGGTGTALISVLKAELPSILVTLVARGKSPS
jgi:hypothetical protein